MLELLDASNTFYKSLLGYKPENTFLQSIPESHWNVFTQTNGLVSDSLGVYLPRSQTAVVRDDNPLSLFHEYFGHGLYCEQSLSGRKLVELERNVAEDEYREFKGREFTLLDLNRFRSGSGSFQKLNEFRKQNLVQHELFAIWTEYLLSGEFSLRDEFNKKYDSLPKQDKEFVESVINFSRQYGNLATFYTQGLARNTTPDRVKLLLEGVYGTEAINNSRLILLTGSKKPFSDIDLFASSNNLQPIVNEWLDLVSFREDDFERRVKLFEPMVMHPIMAGEFVAGDKNYLQQKQQQLANQPITLRAIIHNFEKAEKERIFANEAADAKLRHTSLGYAKTYLANALALSAGKRLYTRENLEEYSQNEKDINLKGGGLV